MPRTFRALGICYLLTACSSADPSQKTAEPAVEPRPICGKSMVSACVPRLPPLSEEQKNTLYAAMEAQLRTNTAMNSFVVGKKPEDGSIAELYLILTREGCIAETSTGPDGRLVSKVFGERCSASSMHTALVTEQDNTSRIEADADIQVTGEEFAQKSQLRRLATSSNVSTTNANEGEKRTRSAYQRSGNASLSFTEGEKASVQNEERGEVLLDLSDPYSPKALSFRDDSSSFFRFPGFQALLLVRGEMNEDGTGKIETWLNGEKQGPGSPAIAFAKQAIDDNFRQIAEGNRR